MECSVDVITKQLALIFRFKPDKGKKAKCFNNCGGTRNLRPILLKHPSFPVKVHFFVFFLFARSMIMS